MTAEMNSSFVTLERRELMEFADCRGVTIACVAGSLWVTRLGSSVDSVLQPGEAMTVDAPGSVVVQGLQRSALRVTRPATPVGASPSHLMAHLGAALHGPGRALLAARGGWQWLRTVAAFLAPGHPGQPVH